MCFLLARAMLLNPAFLLPRYASAVYGLTGRGHYVCCGRFPGSCRLGLPETRFAALRDASPPGFRLAECRAGHLACPACSQGYATAVRASLGPACTNSHP